MEKIIIIGNPNTGKTTLFNTLTKSHEKVANYSGVTVAERERCVNFCNNKLNFVDLPGVYSINSSGADEKVSINYLEKNKDAKIIYVATTSTLEKNLNLFLELAKKGFNVSLFVNEFGAKITKESIQKLQNKLRIPVYYGDARKKRKDILNWIIENVLNFIPLNKLEVGYDAIMQLLDLKLLKRQQVDKVIMHPIFGKVIFVAILGIVYYISFVALGDYCGYFITTYWNRLGELCISSLAKWNMYFLIDFFQVVVINGLGSVISFLPTLFILLFCMNILEESGYLPRVAYLFNIDLNKIGLNGKSIFGMSIGIGCTTSGILASRNIDDNICRLQTCKFLPFIGCSAKIPIVLFLASEVLMGNIGIVFVIFLLTVGAGITYLKFSTPKDEVPFIMEVPRLAVPSFKHLVIESSSILKDFLKRVAGTVLLVSSAVWVLMTIEVSIVGKELTLLDIFANCVGIFFKPIGLDKKPIIVSLIAGLVAKENILSTISMFDLTPDLSVVSIVSFLLFIMLYSPCLPALRCAKAEFGSKFAIRIFISQTILAYGVSFVLYTFGSAFGLLIGFIASAVFIILSLACYSIFKSKCKINCKNCIIKHKSEI
ncbi:MAG: ferrous iron transporter B [Clostridia bacterium]|nr:ferrous iron transporter B [Clostridia bacterium]